MAHGKKLKVLIGTPSYDGKLDIYYIDSLLNTLNRSGEENMDIYPFFICYDSLIQRARNDLFKTAYENDVDVLVFIDGDIGWKPDDFYKLIHSEKDLVGGSYRKKTDKEEMYVVKALDENDKELNLSIDKDGYMEVFGLGCGFMKLSKKCIRDLWNASKPYKSEKGDARMIFEVVCENEDLISEDIYMCKKWRQLGNKVYLDTNITCSHTGIKNFVGNVNSWIKSFQNKSIEPQQGGELDKYFNNQQTIDDDLFKVLV